MIWLVIVLLIAFTVVGWKVIAHAVRLAWLVCVEIPARLLIGIMEAVDRGGRR